MAAALAECWAVTSSGPASEATRRVRALQAEIESFDAYLQQPGIHIDNPPAGGAVEGILAKRAAAAAELGELRALIVGKLIERARAIVVAATTGDEPARNEIVVAATNRPDAFAFAPSCVESLRNAESGRRLLAAFNSLIE